MTTMANIHVRDVPPETVEALRAAARRHRRSLNAEIVQVLVDRAARERRGEDWLAQVEKTRRRWQRWFPEGFPPGLEPETIIRRHRDGGS
jgi:plasmid stability protein